MNKSTSGRRKRSMDRKTSQMERENNAPDKKGRRGRPPKTVQHTNKILKENDHSYEKRKTHILDTKVKETCSMSSIRKALRPRKEDMETSFNGRTICQFSQQSKVNVLNADNTFSSVQNTVAAMPKQHINSYEQNYNKFMQWQDGKQTQRGSYIAPRNHIYKTKRSTSHTLQNKKNIAPLLSGTSTVTPTAQSNLQPGCKEILSKFQIKMNGERNHHCVMLKINDPIPTYYKTKRVKTSSQAYVPKTKLNTQNGHISKQLLLAGRTDVPKPSINSVSTDATNMAVPIPLPANGFRRYAKEETQAYKPYNKSVTDSYVTREFLAIREAYFRHYPERRPAFDNGDLRIYK